MARKRVESAARAAGISPTWINAHGQPQAIPDDTQRRLLEAMHRTALGQKTDAALLPNVLVSIRGVRKPIIPQGKGCFHWQLTTEAGKSYYGDTMAGDALPLN